LCGVADLVGMQLQREGSPCFSYYDVVGHGLRPRIRW
jgi:hypothetical protein